MILINNKILHLLHFYEYLNIHHLIKLHTKHLVVYLINHHVPAYFTYSFNFPINNVNNVSGNSFFTTFVILSETLFSKLILCKFN